MLQGCDVEVVIVIVGDYDGVDLWEFGEREGRLGDAGGTEVCDWEESAEGQRGSARGSREARDQWMGRKR